MRINMKKPVSIPVSKLHPFEEHPYKVLDNEEMNTLTESIETQGVLSPLIVRPLEDSDDEYEVVSGHRRLHAAEKAGLEKVPALIYAISRDEAAIMLVDSNLHRERILPSEKAFAYKMKFDAISHQGKTSDQVGPKLTVEQISETDSASQVKRYIRLTNLIPELLELMDDGKIAFSVGVELSYLDEQSQYDVLEQCEMNDCTPSYSQAYHFHKAMNEGTLNKEYISDLMNKPKANQRQMLKIPSERFNGKIPSDFTPKQTEDFIVKAVEHYSKYLRSRKEQER